ncbi:MULTISPECIES: STAS domain-containing protein [unclassified Blastococcus]
MQFEVQRTTVKGHSALRVRGELDIATSPQLGDAVADALESGATSLVVDLTETTFLDSSGARQLTRTARHCGELGVGLQVVCPADNRPVRLVLDLLELHLAVPIVEKAGFAGGGVGS